MLSVSAIKRNRRKLDVFFDQDSDWLFRCSINHSLLTFFCFKFVYLSFSTAAIEFLKKKNKAEKKVFRCVDQQVSSILCVFCRSMSSWSYGAFCITEMELSADNRSSGLSYEDFRNVWKWFIENFVVCNAIFPFTIGTLFSLLFDHIRSYTLKTIAIDMASCYN